MKAETIFTAERIQAKFVLKLSNTHCNFGMKSYGRRDINRVFIGSTLCEKATSTRSVP